MESASHLVDRFGGADIASLLGNLQDQFSTLLNDPSSAPQQSQVVATATTLAQGINLPADVVLIVGETRYDTVKQRNVPIDAHEILNAAGRAGRPRPGGLQY